MVVVTQEDVCTLQSGFRELITARPESRSGIEDDDLVIALDFDTTGIAPVNGVIDFRAGEAAPDSPEFNSHIVWHVGGL
jgi:hypothetical protein